LRNTSSWQHNHDRKNIAHCHPSSHPHTKKLLFNGQNDHMKMVIPFIAFLPSPIKIIELLFTPSANAICGKSADRMMKQKVADLGVTKLRKILNARVRIACNLSVASPSKRFCG
jgi:hypothetical protein